MNHKDMYCNHFNLRKYFLLQVCKNVKSSCSCTELRKAFVKKMYKYKTTRSTNRETRVRCGPSISPENLIVKEGHVWLQCSDPKAASSHTIGLSGIIQSGQEDHYHEDLVFYFTIYEKLTQSEIFNLGKMNEI